MATMSLASPSRRTLSLNTRIATALSGRLGTMWTAYCFAILAIGALLGILGLLPPLVVLLVSWFSQTFIQLCFLPIIMIGQEVMERKSEVLARKHFGMTQRSYRDIKAVLTQLAIQETRLLEQQTLILLLLEHQQIAFPKSCAAHSRHRAHLSHPRKRPLAQRALLS